MVFYLEVTYLSMYKTWLFLFAPAITKALFVVGCNTPGVCFLEVSCLSTGLRCFFFALLSPLVIHQALL